MLWGPMIGQLRVLKEGLGVEDQLAERLATTEIVVIFDPDKSKVNAGSGSICFVGASRGDGGGSVIDLLQRLPEGQQEGRV